MPPLARLPLLVILVVGALLFLAWWLQPDDPLTRLAPDLDPVVREPIHAADTNAVARLCRTRGSWSSVRTYDRLRDAMATGAPLTEADHARLGNALSVWAEGLARGVRLPEYRRDAARRRACGPDTAAMLSRRWQVVAASLVDTSLAPDTLRARLAGSAAFFREAGDPMGAVRTAYHLANLDLKRGDLDAARRGFTEVLAGARRWELTAATCDALNSLALFAAMQQDTAGAAMLSESLRLARRSRLAARAGRALTVAGIHAHREGRFARALDLLEQAVRACDELDHAWQGLPYLVYLMRIHAGLGDWRQVALLAPRAEVLLREAETAGADPLLCQREGVRLAELQLRLDVHEGRVTQALEAYPSLIEAARRLPFAELAYVHDRQLRALLDAGRPAAVLERLGPALAHAEVGDRPERLGLLLIAADAHLDLGDPAAASRALDDFDAAAADNPRWAAESVVDACALRAICEQRRGHVEAARRALETGLRELTDRLRASDASSLAYLEIQRHRLLRRALRAVVRDGSTTAYGLELLWRRLPTWLGEPGPPGALANDPASLARTLADERRRRLGPDRRHLLFVTAGNRLVRWQAGRTLLTCDTLTVAADAIETEVAGLVALLARDPGRPDAPVPDVLATGAQRLASWLLPVDVRAGRVGTVLVSAAGALAQLPFGVLDVDDGPGYAPLAGVTAVAVLRDGDAPTPPRAGRPGVLVADPELSGRVRRRHPELAQLAATAGEIRRVERLAPGIDVLEGPDATLDALTNRWHGARLLYFACHTVRSPESPFRTFVPLAAGAGERDDALQTPYLDIAAIREHDLGGTGLVVLASCAGGAPYVSGRTWAPSLGDAFLDAGAGAVVSTLWQVRDEDAARLPTLFLTFVREDGDDPIVALAKVRRRVMTTRDGAVAHPFGWAAWMLALRDF